MVDYKLAARRLSSARWYRRPIVFVSSNCIVRAGVAAVMQYEQQLLSDVRRYATAQRRLSIIIINSLLVVVLTAIATRLASCVLCWSRDPHYIHSPDPGDDDDQPARPSTVSVNAQTRNFTAFDLRFSETKV